MKTYRIKLVPMGRLITPPYADTLWGHLCWIVKWREGEDALRKFLHAFEEDPPFILSDGFPGDLLPAPAHLSSIVREKNERGQFRKRKAFKNIAWLTVDEFNTVRRGDVPTIQRTIGQGYHFTTSLHSSINRVTGTTGDEGSLFEIEGQTLEKGHGYISVYARIKDGWQDKVAAFFSDLTLMGYGKKRSVGMGSFKVTPLELFNGFETAEKATGFVSLSNFVPTPSDPADGFYKVFVKYGKLGGEYAFTGKPFKKPVMMIKAGSVFKTNRVRPYYGGIMRGIMPEMPEVLQYGYAFAVPLVV